MGDPVVTNRTANVTTTSIEFGNIGVYNGDSNTKFAVPYHSWVLNK